MKQVCLVTALPSESRLFIDHYQLQLIEKRHWRLYANHQVLLVETGVGKLNAAAAVASVLYSQSHIIALINVGVAGSAQPLASCWLAERVTDAGTGSRWYTHLPPKKVTGDLGTLPILTLDSPSEDYRHCRMMDMEASGIVAAARPYLANHAIQFVKVVSDNTQSDYTLIDKSRVKQLMHSTLEPVTSLVDWFGKHTVEPLPVSAMIQQVKQHLVSKQHFSHTQRHLLDRKLRQLENLSPQRVNADQLIQTQGAKETLYLLDKMIRECDLTYPIDN